MKVYKEYNTPEANMVAAVMLFSPRIKKIC
jgi:hypothetical protein